MSKKRMSKRITCRKRYKIIKKVNEHHRKLRKIGKNTNKCNKKDLGIPNKFPFKEQLLREYIQSNEKEQLEKIKLKEERKQQKLQKKQLKKHEIIETLNKSINLPPTLQEFVNNANLRNEEFSNKQEDIVENNALNDRSYRRFNKELHKVIEASDIIVEVLDARDPLGTRSPFLENNVYKSGQNKQLVLLLNKIDLIPKEVTLRWLSYLRNEYPTLAFKASTQNQKSKLAQSKISFDDVNESLLHSSVCIGASTLISFLKTFKKNEKNGVIGTLTVGVVGLPNVGKSSVINSLRRSKVCQVGSIPGITKNMKEIKIDSSIRIIDCPGVVSPSMDRSTLSTITIDINSIDFTNDNDYMIPINNILKCCSESQIREHLEIPEYKGDSNIFLAHLSKRYGKFKKGAIPDLKAAAIMFLNFWKSGKIKYHFLPPDNKYFQPLTTGNAQSWKQNFNMDAIKASEQTDLNQLLKEFSSNLLIESHYIDNKSSCYVGNDFAAKGSNKSNFVLESKKMNKNTIKVGKLASKTISAVNNIKRKNK